MPPVVRQVEVDLVGGRRDDGGTGLGFAAGEIGPGHGTSVVACGFESSFSRSRRCERMPRLPVLRVALLRGERAVDARESLDDQAPQRRHVGVRVEPGAARVGERAGRERRRVEAVDELLGDRVAALAPRSASSIAKYRSTNASSSAGSFARRKPSAVSRTTVFVAVSTSMSDDQARSLPSSVWIAARACAADCWPVAVLSPARRSSISASPARPAATSAIEQLPAEVGVDLEALEFERAVVEVGELVDVRARLRDGGEVHHELELRVAAGLGLLRRGARSRRRRHDATRPAARVPCRRSPRARRWPARCAASSTRSRSRCCRARARGSRSRGSRRRAWHPTPSSTRGRGPADPRSPTGSRARRRATPRRAGSSRRRGRRR